MKNGCQRCDHAGESVLFSSEAALQAHERSCHRAAPAPKPARPVDCELFSKSGEVRSGRRGPLLYVPSNGRSRERSTSTSRGWRRRFPRRSGRRRRAHPDRVGGVHRRRRRSRSRCARTHRRRTAPREPMRRPASGAPSSREGGSGVVALLASHGSFGRVPGGPGEAPSLGPSRASSGVWRAGITMAFRRCGRFERRAPRVLLERERGSSWKHVVLLRPGLGRSGVPSRALGRGLVSHGSGSRPRE